MSRNVLANGECGFIYLVRKETGLSQEDFGVLIGVSKNSISLYETMQIIPSTYVLQNLMALGLDGNDILRCINVLWHKSDSLDLVCSNDYLWSNISNYFWVVYSK